MEMEEKLDLQKGVSEPLTKPSSANLGKAKDQLRLDDVITEPPPVVVDQVHTPVSLKKVEEPTEEISNKDLLQDLAFEEWTIPENFDWSKSTKENYAVPGNRVYGRYKSARWQLDHNYHGNYTKERQLMQDVMVTDVVGGIDSAFSKALSHKEPWAIFTAGAMASGKGHTVRWMSKYGYLPKAEMTIIDIDSFRENFPEWRGYLKRDEEKAGYHCQKEAAMLTEVATEVALQNSLNLIVDGSLRDGDWYSKYFEYLKKTYPHYRIAVVHVIASKEVVLERARQRGKNGRPTPEKEILDSFNRVPATVDVLFPWIDFLARVENNGGRPKLKTVYNDHDKWMDRDTSKEEELWEQVASRFSSNLLAYQSGFYIHVISSWITQAPVVVFSKSYCSFSKKLEALLKSLDFTNYKKVEFDKYETGPYLQQALSKFSKSETVPQIFISGRAFGGYSEVKALADSGKLLKILEAAKTHTASLLGPMDVDSGTLSKIASEDPDEESSSDELPGSDALFSADTTRRMEDAVRPSARIAKKMYSKRDLLLKNTPKKPPKESWKPSQRPKQASLPDLEPRLPTRSITDEGLPKAESEMVFPLPTPKRHVSEMKPRTRTSFIKRKVIVCAPRQAKPPDKTPDPDPDTRPRSKTTGPPTSKPAAPQDGFARNETIR